MIFRFVAYWSAISFHIKVLHIEFIVNLVGTIFVGLNLLLNLRLILLAHWLGVHLGSAIVIKAIVPDNC